jgi:peptidoglycan/xylan/chitin deacetylase (PgdA/CDA1 family)
MIALEYHDVVERDAPDESGFPGRAAGAYKLSVPDFESHVATLSSLIEPSRRAVVHGGVAPAAARTVALTFDDGGKSALPVIADRLERMGWRGHFFIATDCIGTRGFLTDLELRELRDRGHVVGSHSRSHPLRMSALTTAELRREWSDSVRRLEDVLSARVTVASLPGGAYSTAVASTAAEAGIQTLFTSEPTTTPRLVLGCMVVGRFTIRSGDSSVAVAKIFSANPYWRLRQWTAWNAKKLAKRAAGSAYLRIRRRLLEG